MDGAIEAFGTLRTLWASDWPLSTESASYAQLLGLVRSLPFLDEGGCRQILSGTADRLWPLS
jgi:predicted TIM-barrel fold metal-dependent hydrolase